jgi:hypothetical protein
MTLIDTTSLFSTVDNVSEALFFKKMIGPREKTVVADFIAGRQGGPYAYADGFAPTETDLARDLILFTGEKIKTTVGKCHTISEEASRILLKLGVSAGPAADALTRANTGMRARLDTRGYAPRHGRGTYCCKPCSCALWLNLAAGGLDNDAALLEAGMNRLQSYRDGDGRWFGFPYYYLLYILDEMDPALARAEILYARPGIVKRLARKSTPRNRYDERRRRVCEQLLEKQI